MFHDTRYHKIYNLSNIIIVLVFNEKAYLFERTHKEKKTKE